MAGLSELDPAAVAAEIVARVASLPEQSTQPVRRLRREYSARLRLASAVDVHAVADELMREPFGHLRRFVAYELIAAHRPARRHLTAERVEQLGRGMVDWGAVDMFGALLSGPAWRDAQLDDGVIERWARSDDRWWRRAALVSTTGLNVSGTSGDARRTLNIARLLVDDRGDMIVKAMSWALRALAQRDPMSARAFLDAEGNRLAARVRREVAHKLETGRKQPRRLGAVERDLDIHCHQAGSSSQL
jgi:3-methyladenine DNA glycosylase AlkD